MAPTVRLCENPDKLLATVHEQDIFFVDNVSEFYLKHASMIRIFINLHISIVNRESDKLKFEEHRYQRCELIRSTHELRCGCGNTLA